ncbi:MAG: DUF296 domain-containing protein [Acetobacteraceae bacterium]|nr:DUF296 domain-containing protein [Acetobacteraceae bacterium]
MLIREFRPRRWILGRLEAGRDLLQGLLDLAEEQEVRVGAFTLLGALTQARLGFYDQKKKSYRTLELDRHLEISCGVGNVSLRDGRPAVHCHLVVSGEDGECWGGHLLEGTVVFACEFALADLEGEPLERRLDPDQGLALWPLPG